MQLVFFLAETGSAEETIIYNYDALDRLTGVEYVGKGSVNYRFDKAGDITNLTILVSNSAIVDTDHDGIADDWEMLYFGNLTLASAVTDSDHDRYSDLWEYLNWKEGIIDQNHQVFSPLLTNSLGSRGYKAASIWIMIMPAILHNHSK